MFFLLLSILYILNSNTLQIRAAVEEKARFRIKCLRWGGLVTMCTVVGITGRLTWWEYSWDIMEPVTYFLTYGTSIGMFAYYVLTQQVSDTTQEKGGVHWESRVG